MIRDQFDVLYEDGAKTGRVMSICLHPFLIGHPHRSKTKGNTLFHDGSVWLCKVYTPLPGMTPIQTSRPGNLNKMTDLADWMICHPGHLDAASVNRKTTPDDVWKRGRPLPTF